MAESAIARLARLTGNDAEQIELGGVRKVATLEGARYYGAPIGTPIKAAKAMKAVKRGASSVKPGGSKSGVPTKPGGGRSKASAPNAPRRPRPDAPDADRPSAVDKVKGTRAPRPLTDAEYQQRAEELSKAIIRDFTRGTDVKYSLDGEGKVWEKERTRLHVEIANAIYEKEFEGVPSDGRALFSGGLGGAGKGTLLGSGRVDGVGDIKKDFGTVNPDDVKEYMAENFPDMIPDAPEYKTKLEASGLIHEESSHIANMIAERAYAERKNIVWDITMSKEKSVQDRLDRLRESGYEDIQAVFIDIPVEVSVKRALQRHRRGMEEERAFREAGIRPRKKGKEVEEDPLGGRFVPPEVIRHQTAGDSSKNRLAFDALRDQFDTWSLWDNAVDNRDAVKLEAGTGTTPATRQNRRRAATTQTSISQRGLAKVNRKELEAERAKLAEELQAALMEGYEPGKEDEYRPSPKVNQIKARLYEIRQELGLSAVDRLRGMLHL